MVVSKSRGRILGVIILILFLIAFVESKENDEKPTLHMLGLFHTITNKNYSHCAFTSKVLKFSKMMQLYGWKIIEYGNAYTESGADEFVQMLTEEELNEFKTSKKKTDFVGNDAVIGTPQHVLFEERLFPEIKKRLKTNDIVLHPFGKSHSFLVEEFDQVYHGKR